MVMIAIRVAAETGVVVVDVRPMATRIMVIPGTTAIWAVAATGAKAREVAIQRMIIMEE
jgi:hypothetical protein